jgi:hypothetical protein
MRRMMLGFSVAKQPVNPKTKRREQKKRFTPLTIGRRLAAGKNLLIIDAGISSGGLLGRPWAVGWVT